MDSKEQSESVFLDNPDLDLVRQDGLALRHIKNPSEAVIIAAVQQNGLALQFVPAEKQTYQVCAFAVVQNGRALQHVAKQSESICMAAIRDQQAALAMVRIPQTREMILCAVSSAPKRGCALAYAKIQDEEICLAAVTNDPHALQYVWQQTPKIVQRAVQTNGLSLMFVQEHLMTPDLCKMAVRNDGRALAYCRTQHTPELIALAMESGRNSVCIFANV